MRESGRGICRGHVAGTLPFLGLAVRKQPARVTDWSEAGTEHPEVQRKKVVGRRCVEPLSVRFEVAGDGNQDPGAQASSPDNTVRPRYRVRCAVVACQANVGYVRDSGLGRGDKCTHLKGQQAGHAL